MFIKIVILYVVFIFSTFVHELGRIMTVKIFYNTRNCGIEIGSRKVVFRPRKIVVRAIPASGHTYWESADLDRYNNSDKTRKITPAFGGPLSSLIMSTLFAVAFHRTKPYRELLYILLKFPIFTDVSYFIVTVLPIKYLDNMSDGQSILDIMKSAEDGVN